VYRGYSPRITSKRISETSFQTWGKGARFACVPTLDGNYWFVAITEEKDPGTYYTYVYYTCS
jgi:hypothetical protein